MKNAAPPSAPEPTNELRSAGWWHADGDRIVCDLCPRHCSLKNGDRGFCFVRENVGGQMVLNTYGRSTGFCVDPVEKKPLHHFYPGSSVLSFGTAGCNLGCKFCQAWQITKSRDVLTRLSREAAPRTIAEAAVQLGCHSVAFTYNDPVIWAEYAIDTAVACRQRGLKTIAVTAGYICPEPRREFFEVMDAANVDLKGFTEAFYQQCTLSHLDPVLDTLRWIKRESSVWLEITNLVIPGKNDSATDVRRMCEWIRDELGSDVPLHFTGFHPDYRMLDTPATRHTSLIQLREVALDAGLQYAYLGNVFDPQRESTYCPGCGKLLIERRSYEIGVYDLRDGCCKYCRHPIAGRFADKPGDWGAQRLPVDPSIFQQRPKGGR